MELNILSRLSRDFDAADPEPCKDCGHCCHYLTVSLKAPRGRADYDEIRWFLIHENISVYIDDDGWYVEFRTVCKHLDGYRCGIYHTRPHVCSDYAVESCERYGEGAPHLHLFTDERQYLAYLKRHRPRAYDWVMNPRPEERQPKRSRRRNGSNGKGTNGQTRSQSASRRKPSRRANTSAVSAR